MIFASVDTDQHLMHILFGNILGITPVMMLIQISAICLITITIMLVKQKKTFMLYCFDPNQARIVGLPGRFITLWRLTLYFGVNDCRLDASRWDYFSGRHADFSRDHRLSINAKLSRMITLAILFLL